MAQINLNEEETRLIGVHRAIVKFNKTHLVDTSDASAVYEALKSIVDLDELEKKSNEEVQAHIQGFLHGLAAARIEGTPYELSDFDQTEFVGEGPSGGVAVGQGQDSRYVNQSGVH